MKNCFKQIIAWLIAFLLLLSCFLKIYMRIGFYFFTTSGNLWGENPILSSLA